LSLSDEQLAQEIAKGIGQTGIEGFYNSVSCSTAGDYPSMGISQWEGVGGRGDDLLNSIDGGAQFAGRTYSDIRDNEGIGALQTVLDSISGRAAQDRIIAFDCLAHYVPSVKEALSNDRCIIYAGMWCPTSHRVVRRFLLNRVDSFDLNNLDILHELFRDAYYIAASVGEEYAVGYANRANITYDYVLTLNI
jgi:hypothetical protein